MFPSGELDVPSYFASALDRGIRESHPFRWPISSLSALAAALLFVASLGSIERCGLDQARPYIDSSFRQLGCRELWVLSLSRFLRSVSQPRRPTVLSLILSAEVMRNIDQFSTHMHVETSRAPVACAPHSKPCLQDGATCFL